jgi:hypothetical protein
VPLVRLLRPIRFFAPQHEVDDDVGEVPQGAKQCATVAADSDLAVGGSTQVHLRVLTGLEVEQQEPVVVDPR